MAKLIVMISMLFSTAWAGEPAASTLLGRQLYVNAGGYGCAVCHGPVGDGAGQAGGYIRGATIEQLKQSLASNAPMQPLANLFSDSDLTALGSYLTELAETPLINLTFSVDGWTGSYEATHSGQVVDVVAYNSTFNSITVDLRSLGIEPFDLLPLQRLALQGRVQSLELDLISLGVSWVPSK